VHRDRSVAGGEEVAALGDDHLGARGRAVQHDLGSVDGRGIATAVLELHVQRAGAVAALERPADGTAERLEGLGLQRFRIRGEPPQGSWRRDFDPYLGVGGEPDDGAGGVHHPNDRGHRPDDHVGDLTPLAFFGDAEAGGAER